MHTFSPAKMWITGLDALRKPLLHLHTQANAALPWQSIDMDFMNLNQAAHGDREFGYIQTRLGMARKTVAGHVSDPAVATSIGKWVDAARGFATLRTLRMARFGDNMRDVAVTDGDKVQAELVFGVSVNTYGVNDLVAAVDALGDKVVDDLVDEYAERYDVVRELRADGERHLADPTVFSGVYRRRCGGVADRGEAALGEEPHVLHAVEGVPVGAASRRGCAGDGTVAAGSRRPGALPAGQAG